MIFVVLKRLQTTQEGLAENNIVQKYKHVFCKKTTSRKIVLKTKFIFLTTFFSPPLPNPLPKGRGRNPKSFQITNLQKYADQLL